VPSWLAAPSAGRPGLSGTCEAPRRIDINSAAWYEWTLFEGIGEARARRIVEARRERGGFSSLDDLADIPGMPEGWVEGRSVPS
jgi:DNA uptake protein ComE-like DNA-binding protein